MRIEHEFDWLGQEKSFAVFAIDDGFPVMAQLKYMRRLTKDQANMPSNVIHRGAISCVLPCEKVIILTSKLKDMKLGNNNFFSLPEIRFCRTRTALCPPRRMVREHCRNGQEHFGGCL